MDKQSALCNFCCSTPYTASYRETEFFELLQLYRPPRRALLLSPFEGVFHCLPGVAVVVDSSKEEPDGESDGDGDGGDGQEFHLAGSGGGSVSGRAKLLAGKTALYAVSRSPVKVSTPGGQTLRSLIAGIGRESASVYGLSDYVYTIISTISPQTPKDRAHRNRPAI